MVLLGNMLIKAFQHFVTTAPRLGPGVTESPSLTAHNIPLWKGRTKSPNSRAKVSSIRIPPY
jgi:hypothetical protein